jgi:hypothetical protein
MQTVSSLNEWGDLLELVMTKNLDDPTKYSDCGQALAEWTKKRFVQSGSSHLETDSWGRQYLWKARKDGTKTVVYVRSAGKNGISKEGDADDLSVEVTLSGRQAVAVYGKGMYLKPNNPGIRE